MKNNLINCKIFKKDIVKSQILNLLNKNTEKIFARKCYTKEVSVKETRKFLDSNHIQGFVGSQIKLGLFYNDELVSLMTFGKPRKNMTSNMLKLPRNSKSRKRPSKLQKQSSNVTHH